MLQVKVKSTLGYQFVNLLDTYLGLPLMIKEVTTNYWNTILERMQKKLVGWKGKILSNARKLQLIVATLQGIPIYFLSIFKINQNMVDKLENL